MRDFNKNSDRLEPRLTYLRNNVVEGTDYIVQVMACVETTGLAISLASRVLLHHFVIQKPQTLGHVPKIRTLAPNTEP